MGGLIAKHKGRDYLRWVLRGALGGAIVMFVILAIFVLIAIYALGQVKWD